ncbi:MAG: hypothetical protein KI791_22740 [Cyclobacteriaceae bacterium]|nr:hypothetical protein [Cyclobacteriaceae bacterium SS2]
MRSIFKMIFAITVMAGLIACNEDEDGQLSPVVAQFQGDVSIAENSGANKIALVFNKAAVQNGQALIEVSSDFEEAFYLDTEVVDGKITLEIEEGDTAAFIVVTPVDDMKLEDSKTLTLSINELSEGFLMGQVKDIEITILDDEAPARISFSEGLVEIKENSTGGRVILLTMPTPAPAPGKVTIEFDQSIENLVASDLTFTDGIAEIDIPFGARQVTFFVGGVDNTLLQGHKSVGLTITKVEGALQIGDLNTMNLKVLDDELIGKPKSYETAGGGWFYSKVYEYDEKGRVEKIHWEQRTPGTSRGTQTITYDEQGNLLRITDYENSYEVFTYENGRIVKSENIKNDVVKSYNLYDYDEAGNLGGMASFYLQPNGVYLKSLVFIYLNYSDGNIYKKLVYSVGEANGEEELTLISTETFRSYHNKANPFPAFNVIPTIVSQSKLPGGYLFEDSEKIYHYDFTYVFNLDGMPTSRRVTGSSNEVTYYYYY